VTRNYANARDWFELDTSGIELYVPESTGIHRTGQTTACPQAGTKTLKASRVSLYGNLGKTSAHLRQLNNERSTDVVFFDAAHARVLGFCNRQGWNSSLLMGSIKRISKI
jgi:hypothetical protein